MSHTPGPWELRGPLPVTDSNGVIIVRDISANYPGTPEANARLIAAAPDLLAALESLFQECAMVHKHWGEGSNQRTANEAIEAGRAAIAKAKGAA